MTDVQPLSGAFLLIYSRNWNEYLNSHHALFVMKSTQFSLVLESWHTTPVDIPFHLLHAFG